MSRVYDNWERLVGAVLNREQLRYLALCPSFASSCSTSFSFDSDAVSASGISHPEASSSPSILSYRQVKPIEFNEIKKATKNFRTDWGLGEGGFGRVFKGWVDEDTLTASKPGSGMAVAIKIFNLKHLQQGRDEWLPGSGMAVAVKKLLDWEGFQGRLEWRKELNYLSQFRHPNIIKLFGYCEEEDNLILVYEFMPKGSLDKHLFGRRHQSLSWTTRIKVAVDVARGLSFLHEMDIPIIYRGLHAGDILLDREFNAKLSDFGLARHGRTGDMTHVSTRVMGTYGYAAPEYVATGHLTTKCDVFGYGVVLLELLCGRRVIDRSRVAKEKNLVDWAKPYLGDKKRLSRIIDAKLEGQYPVKETRKVGLLALQCLSDMPKRRPAMAEVLVALEQL